MTHKSATSKLSFLMRRDLYIYARYYLTNIGTTVFERSKTCFDKAAGYTYRCFTKRRERRFTKAHTSTFTVNDLRFTELVYRVE